MCHCNHTGAHTKGFLSPHVLGYARKLNLESLPTNLRNVTKQPILGSLLRPSVQVLGFDILLDDRLHPHLLEVNSVPSLRVAFGNPDEVNHVISPTDMEIKLPVVRGTLRIIGNKLMGYHSDTKLNTLSDSLNTGLSSNYNILLEHNIIMVTKTLQVKMA